MCDNGGATEKCPASALTDRGDDRKVYSDMAHSTEMRQALLDALGDTASELQRAASRRLMLIRLARLEGATNQSIADVLGVTEPAVRSMLKRHA